MLIFKYIKAKFEGKLPFFCTASVAVEGDLPVEPIDRPAVSCMDT